MHSLYILKSERRERTYIGISSHVSRRLSEHNAGLVRSTKAYRPWKLVYVEHYATKTESRSRELQLKRHSATKESLYKKLGLEKRRIQHGPMV